MSNPNDPRVPGRCPACGLPQLKRRTKGGNVYCHSCKDTGFTDQEIRDAEAKFAEKPAKERYIGKPAGRITIPQYRWNGTRLG